MDKKLVGLSVLFVVAFLIFSGYVFFSGSLNILTRAALSNNVASEQNSLIFAWPLVVPADGKGSSEVTVFIRNSDGKGLEGHQVSLSSSVGVVSPEIVATDTDGKATFQLNSTTPGVAEIDTIVDTKSLLRKISVQFE